MHLLLTFCLRLKLAFVVGVPQVHHFGQEGLHNVLVIDLLGPNLEDLFDMCGRKFTIKTVCMAAKQMVSDLNTWCLGVISFLLSYLANPISCAYIS